MKQIQYKIGDTIIGDYKILAIFGGEGKSGMGICYLVESRHFENPFILKTFQKSSVNSINRFKSEAETWLSLGIHPNIVKCLFVDEINEQLFIGAEYVQTDELGRNSVSDYLRTSKVSIYYIIKWIAQFCYAMNYSLSKGLTVHRDIKPDNLMVDNNSNLKVTDFGIAKSNFEQTKQQVKRSENSTTGLTEEGVFLGTLLYSSPEQIIDSSSIDFQSDMYSFGIVVYELISGGMFPYSLKNKTTYEDYIRMHLNDTLVEIDHPLFPIVFKCMQRRPENRFSNYIELLVSLRTNCAELNLDIPKEAIIYDKLLEELYTKSLSYISLNDLEKANDTINEYLEIEKGNSSAWGLKGRIEMHLENYENALGATLKSCNIDPYNSHSLNNLGLIYKNTGNIQKGVFYLEKAVEMDSFNLGALSNLAIAYSENKKYSNAADCILKALQFAPDKKNLLFNAGNIAALVMNNGFPNKSFEILKILVKLDRENSVNWFNLSLLYENLGDFENAIHCLKNVERLKPDDEETLFKIADLTAGLNRFEESIEYCDKIILLGNKSSKAFSYKVQILQLAGRAKEAIRLIKERLIFEDKNDVLWFLLSNIHAGEGDFRNALIHAMITKDLLKNSNVDTVRENLILVEEKYEHYLNECIRRNIDTHDKEKIVLANEKELECILYAKQFYPKTKDKFMNRIFARRGTTIEYQVSSLKIFSDLWSMYGLRDYGAAYWYRGRFNEDDKKNCLIFWVKKLYSIDLDIEKLIKVIINDLSQQRIQMRKTNPGIIVDFSDPVDIIPERIDRCWRNYEYIE